MSEIYVSRGDIFIANLNQSPLSESAQGGRRPVMVLQNNLGNMYSNMVIVATITTKMKKTDQFTHVPRKGLSMKLKEDSVVQLEQIHTISRKRLARFIEHGSPELMQAVDRAMMMSLGVGHLLPQESEGDEQQTG